MEVGCNIWLAALCSRFALGPLQRISAKAAGRNIHAFSPGKSYPFNLRSQNGDIKKVTSQKNNLKFKCVS